MKVRGRGGSVYSQRREIHREAQAALPAFEKATRALHPTEPETFPLERDEQDWWREGAAYVAYTERTERLEESANSANARGRSETH